MAAAIKLAEQRGAKIGWSKKVNGSYFDATLVAPYSNAKYLIAISLVDSAKPVTREEALEFAQRAESAGVNFAILASSSGFDEECAKLTL